MSAQNWMPAFLYIADIGHHLSALWCLCDARYQLVGMLQTLGTIWVRYDVCMTLDINLLVCCRHWTPSKCAVMSVWDSISTCWYVADTGHQLSSLWWLWPSISTCWYFADTGHHLSAHNVCARLHANLFVCCRHWALSKCAMMSVWDSISTSWFVTDIGHHRSALWSLCETGSQLVGM